MSHLRMQERVQMSGDRVMVEELQMSTVLRNVWIGLQWRVQEMTQRHIDVIDWAEANPSLDV